MLFVTEQYFKLLHICSYTLEFLLLLIIALIFRGKVTNFCMINCCLTSLKRPARMATFHCCYVFNLVMITPTISLPPSLMTTFGIMLKLLSLIKLCALWWSSTVLFYFTKCTHSIFGSCDTLVCVWLWISIRTSFMSTCQF